MKRKNNVIVTAPILEIEKAFAPYNHFKGETMKIKDLIEELNKYDPETEVFINEESIKGIFLNEYDELIITQHE